MTDETRRETMDDPNKLPPTSKPGTTEDLFRIASRDVFVRSFLSHWQAGAFPSFEACLIALVCELATQRQRCLDDQLRRAFFEAPPSGAFPCR